tara:strand:+ start:2444 stop:2581 length:138 start_codon:yes stop_codon:yes gene_type:complete
MELINLQDFETAEREGFEPPVPTSGTTAFEAAALSQALPPLLLET